MYTSIPLIDRDGGKDAKTDTTIIRTDTTAVHVSKWGIGWKTPFSLWLFYIAAIAIACVHLVMFLSLQGHLAAGPDGIPQTYVTTASNVLATSFGIALKAALTTAFTQHLWRIFRTETLRLETVEQLYTLRSNPLSFFSFSNLQQAPGLVLLAVLIWTITIATTFPPGAITIGTKDFHTYKNVVVPTFNASYVGNGSIEAISSISFASLYTGHFDQFDDPVTGEVRDRTMPTNNAYGSLTRLASFALIGGRRRLTTSPCGSNCSYVLEFDGPAFSCSSKTFNTTQLSDKDGGDALSVFSIYDSVWQNPSAQAEVFVDMLDNSEIMDSNTTSANLSITTARPLGRIIGLSTDELEKEYRGQHVAEVHELFCIPSTTTYTIVITYIQSVQDIRIVTQPGQILGNTVNGIYSSECGTADDSRDCTSTPSSDVCGCDPSVWSQSNLDWMRDTNILALTDAAMRPLTGEYTVSVPRDREVWNMTLQLNGTDQNVEVGKSSISDEQFVTNGYGTYADYRLGPQNGTIVAETLINTNLLAADYITSVPQLLVTEDLLNELLQNVTISFMNTYTTWNTTVNATISTTRQIYVFSRPSNLVYPYALTLILTLPFLILGMVSLARNGVSAEGGSFLQVLVSVGGSGALRESVRGCDLGGERNFKAVNQLKVRLGGLNGGENRDNGEGGVVATRAGFGAVDFEGVVPLVKGERYGG